MKSKEDTSRKSFRLSSAGIPLRHQGGCYILSRLELFMIKDCTSTLCTCRIVENSSVSAIVFHEQCKDSVS